MVSVPLRAPVAVGVKITLIVQAVPGATVAAQLLVWLKSPLATIAETLSMASPVLVRVTDCAALPVLTSWAANVSEEAERLATGAIPVPLKVVVGAGPAALLLTLNEPLRLPRAVGVKTILIVQLAPASKLTPQLLV